MALLFDSLWRALAYGLRPGVVVRTMLPLMLGLAMVTLAGHFFWDDAVDQMRWWLSIFPYTARLLEWLDGVAGVQLDNVLAPLTVAVFATPFMVSLALLAVTQFLTPALVRLVAERRFGLLQPQYGPANLLSMLWATGSCLLALLALLVSAPLWMIPPLWLLVPPLILGWLTQRVLPFAALVRHASREERVLLVRTHRLRLFVIGMVCGYLAVAPCLLWAWSGGPRFASAFIVLAPLAMCIYILLFAFSSLWFTHYCLAALRLLRSSSGDQPPSVLNP